MLPKRKPAHTFYTLQSEVSVLPSKPPHRSSHRTWTKVSLLKHKTESQSPKVNSMTRQHAIEIPENGRLTPDTLTGFFIFQVKFFFIGTPLTSCYS